MLSPRLKGTLLIFSGAGLWGTLGLFGRTLFNSGLTALDVVTARVVIAWLCFTTLGILSQQICLRIQNYRDLILFALYGAISVALYNIFYFEAIRQTGISVAVALLYTSPAWAAWLAVLFLGERLSLIFLATIVASVSGVTLAVGAVSDQWLSLPVTGLLCGLGAGFSYAAYSIFGKKALSIYQPITTLFYGFGFGGVLLLSLFSIQGGWERLLGIDLKSWLLLLLLGILPTFFAYLVYTVGLHYVSASLAALLATIEPIVAITIALVWVGEPSSQLQVLGITLVIFSNLIASLTDF
ncbi:MAG: EamA family transporter [Halothece sp.]